MYYTRAVPRKTSNGPSVYDAPSYSIAEASRLLRVPQSTLSAWVYGRSNNAGRRIPGVIHAADQSFLSFTNLVEAFTLAAMRRDYRLKLYQIRKAILFVESRMSIARPLARQEFKTDGVSLFVEEFGKLINVSSGGQLAMRQVLQEHLKRVEYKAGVAVRLYPMRGAKQPKSIVVDPKLAYGRPVLRGTGIPYAMIVDRFQAGESSESLAEDYNVEQGLIEDAIRVAMAAA